MALVALPFETKIAGLRSPSLREDVRFPKAHGVSLMFIYAFPRVKICLVQRIFSFRGLASVLAC